jgi:AraC-like DNA-binding protein
MMPIDCDYTPSQGFVEKANAYVVFKPSPPVSHWVYEFWQLNVPMGQYCYRSLPDNCVDFIINPAAPDDAFVVTPFSSAKAFEMTGPVSYFGIRFRLLGHQGLISEPLGVWNTGDKVVSAHELIYGHLLSVFQEGAGESISFRDCCDSFCKILPVMMRHCEVDARLARYIHYCHHNIASSINLSEKQCSAFGLSARHLRRLTGQYLGLSPRDFARVLRFQQTLRLMSSENCASRWTRFYYDQPHFIREFKKMSGVTPREFRNSSVLYNQD